MPNTSVLAHIQGRVQGVGFRYHTQIKARQLGLLGWVRNLPDGSVEACISGSAEQVLAMQAWLKHGPVYANVNHIHFSPMESYPSLADFVIR